MYLIYLHILSVVLASVMGLCYLSENLPITVVFLTIFLESDDVMQNVVLL